MLCRLMVLTEELTAQDARNLQTFRLSSRQFVTKSSLDAPNAGSKPLSSPALSFSVRIYQRISIRLRTELE